MPSHSEILQQCKGIVPPLSPELHKGQAGRIGVLGGSKDYAGAPFFAGMSTLRLGADLAHIICEPAAGNVIKTYSPDLIVHTDLHDNSTEESIRKLMEGLLPRLHVLIIGPGLGRDPLMQLAARVSIKLAREKGVYIVVDADGLWLCQTDPSVVKGYDRCILTPNVVEFGRLAEAVGIKSSDHKPEDMASALSKALGGVTILEKGSVDRIAQNAHVLVNSVEGSQRRCGGQGDVLSGAVGTWLAWGLCFQERQSEQRKKQGHNTTNDDTRSGGDSSAGKLPITVLAAYGASTVTRTASKITFKRLRRAMQTNDMLDDVGEAFESVFGDGAKL